MNCSILRCLSVSLLLLATTASYAETNGAFTYWGTGLQSREFEVAIDLTDLADQHPELAASLASMAEQTPDSVYHLGDTSLGPRFFAGRQFNNYLAIETGAAIGVSSTDLTSGGLNIDGGKIFAVDFKLLFTLPLSDAAFARAHIGSRFYNELIYRVQPPAAGGTSWVLEEDIVATSGLTQGVGLGFAFGVNRAVLLEYERLDRGERPLDAFSLSLLVRL